MKGDQLWTDELLEKLCKRLSTRTSDFEQEGDPSKTLCPKHYSFDIMIPLAIANKAQPMGWVLFSAKYMADRHCSRILAEYVVATLPQNARTRGLTALIVETYMTGRVLSVRRLRRQLDVSRGGETKHLRAIDSALSRLFEIETNYARAVKVFL